MLLSRVILLLFISLNSTGCAVYMAATGNSPLPDLSVLVPGTPRATVEHSLGTPIEKLRPEAPTGVVTYQFFTGEQPNLGRAAVYAVLDVLTLGAAEIVTTPIQALQGDKHIVEVRYDTKNRVVEANRFFMRAPMDAPEKIIFEAVCLKCNDNSPRPNERTRAEYKSAALKGRRSSMMELEKF